MQSAHSPDLRLRSLLKQQNLRVLKVGLALTTPGATFFAVYHFLMHGPENDYLYSSLVEGTQAVLFGIILLIVFFRRRFSRKYTFPLFFLTSLLLVAEEFIFLRMQNIPGVPVVYFIYILAVSILFQLRLRHAIFYLSGWCATGLLLLFFPGYNFENLLTPLIVLYLTGIVTIYFRNIWSRNSLYLRISNLRLAREIKHRRKAEALLAEKNNRLLKLIKELETFAYSLTHDIRTPLQNIITFSDFLRSDKWELLDEEGRHYLQKVLNNSARMEELLEELIRLSRISSVQLERRPVDLSALFQEIVVSCRESHGTQDVQVDIQPNMQTTADPGLLKVALLNLVGNSWKYTARTEGPQIQIGMQAETPPVYYIRDNGAGFDMKEVGRIFRIFERLHKSDDFKGTGVGLATVKSIIEKHGGKIWPESVPNKGATFYFTLE